ncbi:BEN domain-containing protein 5-like [Ixodes scapularis]|uniref:BEN domain-containing protein 5-like n=1 Tax=Ixodes scapularis TaxID=6945 RepID=UPI001A9D337D|nr:BEN domain-containing protein 5-like [Ixodes scapularis]
MLELSLHGACNSAGSAEIESYKRSNSKDEANNFRKVVSEAQEPTFPRGSECQACQLYDDLHQKYLALKKTTRELKEDVEKMRTREAKNTDILDVILEGVNSIKSKLESTGAGCSINANTKHDIVKKAKLRTDGRTVCVNDSVTLSLDQWVACQRQKKESKFVRSLATAIWGRNILKNRSTSGKVSNRLINDGGAAKPPLTPTKLNVLEACYEDWLREHGASGDVLAERMAAMTTHIYSAVRDLGRDVRHALGTDQE